MIRHLGLPLEGDRSLEHSGSVQLDIPPQVVLGATMPDLHDTPKRLLVPLLSRKDIQVLIVGEGRVVRQQPPPGTPITTSMKIRLELE